MVFAEPTFDTDLDVEGFTPTAAEKQNIAAEVDRIRPLVEEFRKAMYPIEESLRDRVGRWVQRYP